MSTFEAWVSYTDANGVARRYSTPARRQYQLAKRIRHLAREKPTNKSGQATSITIEIRRQRKGTQ